MSYVCKICLSKSFEKINTYKYFWHSCNDCGNTFSSQKNNYPLSSFIFSFPIKLFNKLSFNKLNFLERDYLKIQKVNDDKSSFYSDYEDLLKNDDPSLKMWSEEFNITANRLAEENIKFDNKDVLVISGGPGIVANDISKVANKVLVTEFSDITCKAMTDYLGLKTVKYDINTDKLDKVVKGKKFDIIIVKSVIGFCLDLENFFDSLTKVLVENDGIVYINHDSPTFGQMLFYQFDEYTPLVMLQKETFLRVLYKNSNWFKIKEYENKYNVYLFRILQGGWKNKVCYIFRTIFWIYYSLVLLMPGKNINRELCSKSFTYILKK